MAGWIKLYRQLANNPLWTSEPFTKGQAWVDLLILANHKDNFFYKRGNKVIVKRGQVGYSTRGLADRWKWSRGKVDRFLDDLTDELQIEPQKSNVTTIISILNYASFQDREPQAEPQAGRKRAANGPKQESKEGEEGEECKEVLFEDFWDDYHLITGLDKTDKVDTRKYWKKLDSVDKQNAHDNIESYYKSNPLYVKKARTYLSAKSFNDEFGIPRINGQSKTQTEKERQNQAFP